MGDHCFPPYGDKRLWYLLPSFYNMARIVIAVIALAILGIIAPVALQAALEDTGDRSAVNESFTPQSGQVSNLSSSNVEGRFYDAESNITVIDENGAVMAQPEDYFWFARNGTIKTNASGDLAGDSEGFVDYGFVDSDDQARQAADLVAWVPRIMGGLLVLFAVVILGRLMS